MRMRYHLPCTWPAVYTPRLSIAGAKSSLWPPTLPQCLTAWPYLIISSTHPRISCRLLPHPAYGMPLIATAAQSSVLILVRTEAGPFKLLPMQRPHQIQPPVSPRPRHDRDQQASSGSKHETMHAQTIPDLLSIHLC